MRQLTMDDLAALRGAQAPPCVSLYQPTHRHHPDSDQDPIRFRNLCRGLEGELRQKYPDRDVRALLANYRSLEDDADFWNHRTDGLVMLSSPETFRLFEVQRPVRELFIVANRFYMKPLVRIVLSADRYQLLCLSRHATAAGQGSRTGFAYTVRMVDGSSTRIVSDQREIHPGDCVAIERVGNNANIRRASAGYCDPGNSQAISAVQESTQSEALKCQNAKQELAAATNAEEANLAARKIELLCYG